MPEVDTRPDVAYRGLVFHDEAGRWAMLALKAERYWLRYPELAESPDAYRALG